MSTWGEDIEAAIKNEDEESLRQATFALFKGCDNSERFLLSVAMMCCMDVESLTRFWNLPMMNPSKRKRGMVQ